MEKAETVSKEFPRMIMRYNVPMREYTTLHLGGNADVMAEPASQEELSALLAFCEKENIPVSVIGHGSNLLVRDGGIRGVVILIGRGMSHAEVSGAEIRAEAGISLASLSQLACENSLTGCEFMSGIPGTLGGGIVMNAGAYGGEMSQVITRVQAVDYSGREVTLPTIRLV